VTDFAVPIPVMPAWLSLSWTPTRAALVVECARCKVGEVLYTTVLFRDQAALTDAVQKHEGCAA
jgi:hypothetical protein